MNIRWSPLSIERITEISDYIVLDSPTSAEKWVNSIFDRVGQIEDFEESGRIVPELKRVDVRELIFKNYRIIYKIEPDYISILTVKHCRQILPTDELT